MLDREMQRALLMQLREVYPDERDWEGEEGDGLARNFNLFYLHEHGLIAAQIARSLGMVPGVIAARITAAGLDFLEADGGLSAILGVVTVRLEAESIRALVAERIDACDAPPAEKALLKSHLQSLPETALKAGTQELVKLGLSHLPAAIPWLRRWLGL